MQISGNMHNKCLPLNRNGLVSTDYKRGLIPESIYSKVHKLFYKERLQSHVGFDALWCWSILSAENVFQSQVIKLERNIRIPST